MSILWWRCKVMAVREEISDLDQYKSMQVIPEGYFKFPGQVLWIKITQLTRHLKYVQLFSEIWYSYLLISKCVKSKKCFKNTFKALSYLSTLLLLWLSPTILKIIVTYWSLLFIHNFVKKMSESAMVKGRINLHYLHICYTLNIQLNKLHSIALRPSTFS
jgi:hypothetical protein